MHQIRRFDVLERKQNPTKAENTFDLTQFKDASGLENVSNFILSRVVLKNVGRIENQRKIRMTSKGCNLIKVTEVALSQINPDLIRTTTDANPDQIPDLIHFR